MENKDILDSQIFAPESAVANGREGINARLHNTDAWCSPVGTGSVSSVFRSDIYIKIDLKLALKITAIALQGFRSYSYGNALRIHFKAGQTMYPYDPYDLDEVIILKYLSSLPSRQIPVQSQQNNVRTTSIRTLF